jgi:peptide/nickel transport system substrate-binding protein
VMTQRGYYEPNAWPAYDVRAAQNAVLAGKGFSEMARDLGQLRVYRDLAVLEDLLRRLAKEGPADLTDEQHTVMNVAMFRAAYADATKDTPVAPNRSAGLNREAVRDPRRFQTWTEKLFHRTEYHPQANPHHPTLGAWRLIDENDKPDIVAVRNPYYYRVDAQGRQLPYVDAVSTFVSNQKQINLLKLRSGSIDFQSADIAFDDFTVLKQGELAGAPYRVFLWAADSCGGLSFIPLQPHHDDALRRLQEDANIRRAMSLALNRRELFDVVYRGLGEPSQHAVPRGSPYYNPAEASAFVEYNPNRANRLLDAAGLDRRDGYGMRTLPDGQPLILDLNLTQDFPMVAARLAVHYWREVGLNVQMKFRTAQMITRLEGMGLSDIRAVVGGGSYFGPMLPAAYYASHPAEAVQWGAWAVYLRSGGRDGEPAPEPIHDLDRNWQRLVATTTPAAKMAAWKVITDRFAADLPMIGVAATPGQVVVVRKGFKNVPRLALSGAIAHDPGNCCPEAFFFESAP